MKFNTQNLSQQRVKQAVENLLKTVPAETVNEKMFTQTVELLYKFGVQMWTDGFGFACYAVTKELEQTWKPDEAPSIPPLPEVSITATHPDALQPLPTADNQSNCCKGGSCTQSACEKPASEQPVNNETTVAPVNAAKVGKGIEESIVPNA